MDITIVDVLGVKTGIKMGNVRAEYDDENNKLLIFGKLYKREYFCVEGDLVLVVCTIFDKNGRIINCNKGECFGNIDRTDKVVFSLTIDNYDFMAWKKTSRIQLELVRGGRVWKD